ncbi:MAG: hypothetical protein LBC61_06710 [Candidatus Peribacteria bacterium]|jgi:hypothetical protein|nr:hypothetical protein [Candidatus Peribacteria bacterium]
MLRNLKTKVRNKIFVDGFTSKQITSVYLEHFPQKYSLLIPEVQEQIFGMQIIKNLEFDEYCSLYNNESKKDKSIIIAGS